MSIDDQPTVPTAPPNGSRPSPPGMWQAPSVEEMQAMLPQYEVLEILGRGGMGAVYKGRQKSLKRLVAIKILPLGMADDEMKFAERFQNEAQTMAAMNHPAIVSVYDFGETPDGLLYFIMEFVDGTDVQKMIQASGRLSEEYALAITAHVCDALSYAHKRGVIHRDIKPANILIDQEGHIKVADFGLAKMNDPAQTSGLTKTNMAMGTPDYVAPEVLVTGMVADHRADLYAVGVMLYQMLTGEVPRGMFKLPSQKGIGSDPRFDEIICKAMEQDREERYQSAMDVRRDLDVILTTPQPKDDGTGIVSASQIPQKPTQKAAPQQSPATLWLSIGGIVAVLGVAAFFVFSGKPKPASESASPDSSATQSSTSPDSWTDRLGTMTWAAPWSMKDGTVAATTSLALQNLGSATDGAIRIRARVAEGATAAMLKNPVLQPSVRSTTVRPGWRGSYLFQAYMPGRATTLIYMEREDKKVAAEMPPVYLWKEKPLPSELLGKTEIEWEFRTIGDELSLWADGKLVASVHDSRLTSGGSKLQAYPGFEITRLETSGFTPDKTAEAKPGAPPNITNWQDLTEKTREQARTNSGLSVESDGAILRTSGDTPPGLTLTPPGQRDYAVRVHYTGEAQVNLRSQNDGFLFVLCQRNQTLFKRLRPGEKNSDDIGASKPHPPGFDPTREHDLLVTMKGSVLSAWMDGVFIGEAHDDTLTDGTAALMFVPKMVVKKVEVAELIAIPAGGSTAWQPIFNQPEDFGSDLRDVEFRDGATFIKARSFHAPAEPLLAAIRSTMRYLEGDRTGVLSLRSTESAQYGDEDFACTVFISPQGANLVIKMRDRPAGISKLGRHDFPLSPALKEGDLFTFELRAEGKKITAIINGREVGSVTDAWTGSPRRFGITPSNTHMTEFRDVAVQLKSTDAWTDWLGPKLAAGDFAANGWVRSPNGVTTEREISGTRLLPPGTKNAAVRVTYILQDSEGLMLNARERMDGKARLGYCAIDKVTQLHLNRLKPDGRSAALQHVILPAEADRMAERTLELRMIGNQITATLNGTFAGTATDDTLSEGEWTLVFLKGVLVKKVELQPLDAAP